MTIEPNRSCLIAAFSLVAAGWCAGASAQSLTLSLKLDPVAPAAPVAEKTVALVERCSGRAWTARLAASCSPETFSRTAAPANVVEAAAGESSDAAAAERILDASPTAAGEPYSGVGLPTLQALSPGGLLRVAREVPVQASKAVDLLFRFASKYRLRSSDEGADVVKFKDVTSENRTQASGIKGLGVELLFPFQ